MIIKKLFLGGVILGANILFSTESLAFHHVHETQPHIILKHHHHHYYPNAWRQAQLHRWAPPRRHITVPARRPEAHYHH